MFMSTIHTPTIHFRDQWEWSNHRRRATRIWRTAVGETGPKFSSSSRPNMDCLDRDCSSPGDWSVPRLVVCSLTRRRRLHRMVGTQRKEATIPISMYIKSYIPAKNEIRCQGKDEVIVVLNGIQRTETNQFDSCLVTYLSIYYFIIYHLSVLTVRYSIGGALKRSSHRPAFARFAMITPPLLTNHLKLLASWEYT